MRIAVFCLALAATGSSGSLFANAGTTSAGVTTTVGNSTDPSPDVQAQSSGFVQQNQQLQNNAATPNGTTATSATVAATATSGTPTAGNAANAGSADATQPGQAGVAAPPVAPPPAPPPTYESTMRRLDRRNEAPGPTVVASGPRGAVRKAERAEPANPAPSAPASADASPSTNAPAAQTNNAAVAPPAERILQPPAVTGGRGAAPDGFTFYSGVTIASALLAFAFATYLRVGRSET